jgi:hypothetical protein
LCVFVSFRRRPAAAAGSPGRPGRLRRRLLSSSLSPFPSSRLSLPSQYSPALVNLSSLLIISRPSTQFIASSRPTSLPVFSPLLTCYRAPSEPAPNGSECFLPLLLFLLLYVGLSREREQSRDGKQRERRQGWNGSCARRVNCAGCTEDREGLNRLLGLRLVVVGDCTTNTEQSQFGSAVDEEKERRKEQVDVRLRRSASESSMSLLPELATNPAISRAASILRRSRKL